MVRYSENDKSIDATAIEDVSENHNFLGQNLLDVQKIMQNEKDTDLVVSRKIFLPKLYRYSCA
jgi:hypothetical protein